MKRRAKSLTFRVMPVANNQGIIHWEVWETNPKWEIRRGGDFPSRERAEAHLDYLKRSYGIPVDKAPVL